MAETKKLSDLPEATGFSESDTLLMQKNSNGQAMRVSGTKLLNMINGHGGISSIAKSSTSGKTDTYKITLTDGSSSTFTVSNGADGKDGENGTKISGVNVSVVNNGGETSGTATLGNETSSGKPLNITLYNINGRDGSDLASVTADIDNESEGDPRVDTYVSDNPNGGKDLKFTFKKILGKDGTDGANLTEVDTGVSTDTSNTSTRVVPTFSNVDGDTKKKKLHLEFYNINGAKGDALQIQSTVVKFANSSTQTKPTTWVATASPEPGKYLWVQITISYVGTSTKSVIEFPVINGSDGSGSVSTVCNKSPAGGNVTLVATDVGVNINSSDITKLSDFQTNDNVARLKDVYACIDAYLTSKAETWTFTKDSTTTTKKVIVKS